MSTVRSVRHAMTTSNNNSRPGRFTFSCVRDFVYAALLGTQRLEATSATTFPNWQPIPRKLGIWSTSFTLLLATFFLSGDLISDNFAVDVNRDNSTGFCATEDFDEKIKQFEEHVLTNITNYHVGQKQLNTTLKFRDSLLSDTTLYGASSYECPNTGGIGSKADYLAKKKHLEFGAYFPGYCGAALELALQNAKSVTCTERIWICVDDWGACVIGKWINSPITCPSHTYDAESKDLQDYRTEQRKRSDQEEITIKSDVSKEDLDRLQDSTAGLVKKLLRQIDIAGTLYSVYICVALFFPTPLQLYRPSMSVQFKKFFFGAGKYTFIITVLACWWGYQYIDILLQAPAVKIYLRNLVTDPCFLDGDFVSQRYEIVQETCANLINFEHEWGLAKIQIDGIKPEADSFVESCDCNFPGANVLPSFAHHILSPSERYDMASIGFDKSWRVRSQHGLSDNWSLVWSPHINSTFLGNETICLDRDYAREEILVADDTGLSFWEIWIASGLLANLLIKIAIANFGVALLKLADPFCTCEGTYECPPIAKSQGQDQEQTNPSLFVDEHVKMDKAAGLKALAIRETLIWGFLTNSCLLSLVVVAMGDLHGFKTVDYVMFGIVMFLTVSIPFAYYKITNFLNRAVDLQLKELDEDEEGRPV